MLHFLTGAAYSGKTKALNSLTQALCAAEKRVIFLVPEQQTAAVEADLLAFCGNRAGEFLEVLNFQRLPNRVFREIGGVAQTDVSQAKKALLVARILQEEVSNLDYYTKCRISSDLIRELSAFFDELSRGGESAESLSALSEHEKLSSESNLKKKLKDVSRLYEKYLAAYKELYGNSADEQLRLAESFSNPDAGEFFRGATVILDGFYDFTAPQYDLICRMTESASDVYLSLLDSGTGDDLFFRSRAAKALLSARLKPSQYQTVTPEDLGVGAREGEIPKDLSFLCDHVLLSPAAPFDEVPEHIELASHKTPYDEVCAVMRALCRLEAEGTSFSDCAILYRDRALYDPLVQELADQYAIPLYTDNGIALSSRPLARFFLSAARLAAGKLSAEDFLTLLSSDLCPLSHEAALHWERYVKTWSLSGDELIDPSPYTACVFGFTELRLPSQIEENDYVLETINREKQKLCRALSRLRKDFAAVSDCKGRVEVLFRFSEDCRIAETISERIDAMRNEGRFSDAAAEMGLFEACRRALEDLSETEGVLSHAAFVELLNLAFSYAKIGALPSSPTSLAAGDVSFVRLKKVRHLFLLGLNADVFPTATAPANLLSARERSLLAALHEEDPLFFAKSSEHAALCEYFLFYLACAVPTEKLHLSRHLQTLSGDNAEESIFLSRVRTLFPKLPERTGEEHAFPLVTAELYQYLVEMRESDDAFTEKARTAFEAHSARALPKDTETENEERDTLPKATENTIRISQAKLEAYAKCPYQYFLKYLLNLREEERAETNASLRGTLVHKVLENLLSPLADEGKSFHAELKKLDETSVAREFSARRDELIQSGYHLTPSDEALLEDLKTSTTALLNSVQKELGAGNFRPSLFEATLDGDLTPITLPLADGGVAKVSGTADRIDFYRDGVNTYARVVDYKSSGKDFDPKKVLNGLDTQLLLYLITLSEKGLPNKKKGKNEKVLPAGAYYMQLILKAHSPTAAEKAKLAQGEALDFTTFSRDGLFVNTPEAIEAMLPGGDVEDADFAVSRKTKTDKETNSTYADYSAVSGTMVSPEDYEIIKDHVLNYVKETAEDMRAGDVRREPLWDENETAIGCEYCPYLAVCRYEEITPCRTMAKTEKSTFVEDLRKGGIHRG